MKKRLVSIIIVFALLLAVPFSTSQASQMPCFIGVNDTLLPLRDATMPAYFGTKLYVPASVFTEFGISSGTSSSQDSLIVYRSSDQIRLYFYISLGMVLDQNGTPYDDAPLEIIGGLYFLPLDFMCEFFDLSYTIIQNAPLSVLRIKNSSAVYKDRTYIGTYKNQIEAAYLEYSAPSAPSQTPPPNTSDAPPTESPTVEEFPDVTVYLSFYDIDEQYTPMILDTLSDYGVTACFFLNVTDIYENPALIRRISGEKHTVGILLETADLNEYKNASFLLFEAAKLATPLVAAFGEASGEVAALCGENGLIYRAATITPEADETALAITSLLSITPFTADDLRLACSQETTRIISPVIRYLVNFKYTIATISETAANV